MNSPDEQIPADAFTPRGAVTLTRETVNLARSMLRDLKTSSPDEDWVVTILWSPEIMSGPIMSEPDWPTDWPPTGNEWIDHGAGLVMGAYERGRLPPNVIQLIDSVPTVIMIPEHVLAEGKRCVDVEEERHLVLRFVEPGSP